MKQILRFFIKHKDIVILLLAAGLAKVFGFLRSAILANFYGTTVLADEINLLIYPTELVLSFVVNNTIITALVSYFSKNENTENSAFWKSIHFYEIILSILGVIIAIGMISFYPEIPSIWFIVAAGTAILYGISGIIQSYLNYRLLFISSSFQDTVSQVILSVGIILSAIMGYQYFIIFLPLSGLFRILIQLPSLFKALPMENVFSIVKKIIPYHFIDPSLFWFIIPLIIAFFVTNIPTFVIYYIFNTLGEGYISAYNYALKVTALFNPLLVIPITTYVIPILRSKYQKISLLSREVFVILGSILMLSIIFALLTYIGADQITHLFYARGMFDSVALSQTVLILKILSFTIPGYSVMYMLLQIVILSDMKKLVLWSNIIGTIVATGILVFLPRDVQVIGISLIFGTWTSILILFIGGQMKVNNERILS